MQSSAQTLTWDFKPKTPITTILKTMLPKFLICIFIYVSKQQWCQTAVLHGIAEFSILPHLTYLIQLIG